MVTSRNDDNQETVEVVHEALIRNWSQLRQWIEKDRLFRAWQERLRARMDQWSELKLDEGALLQGALLAEAQEKLEERREELSLSEQNFILKSIELRDRLRQQEEERRQLQRETAQKIAQESEARRKAAQTRTRVSVGASVLVLGFAIFAEYQWRKAEIQQIQALVESSAARLASNQDSLETRIASLRAGKMLKQSWWQAIWPDAGVRNQVIGALSQTIYGAGRELNRLEGAQGGVYSVAFSLDGKQLATSGDDGTARLWQVGQLDELLSMSCDWVRGYLNNNPNVDSGDRQLCDGINNKPSVVV